MHGVFRLVVFGTLLHLSTPAFTGLHGKDAIEKKHKKGDALEHEHKHTSHHEASDFGLVKEEKRHPSEHHSRDHGGHESKHRPGIIPSVEEVHKMSTDFLTHHPNVKPVPPTATTTTLVPELFREALKKRASIDELATDNLPAEKAVRMMETEVRPRRLTAAAAAAVASTRRRRHWDFYFASILKDDLFVCIPQRQKFT